MDRDLKYLFFSLIVIVQGLIIYQLFNRSIAIDGDIVSYLDIINGNLKEGDTFEPVSLLIFKLIGFFPSSLHFWTLFAFCYFLAILETWVVFIKTNGSLLWIVFFTVCVVPFAHAINIRTGFGTFFLLMFSNSIVSLILVPFFHTSFLPLITGLKVKVSLLSIIIISAVFFLLSLVLYTMISSKIITYYGFYAQGESIIGVLVELAVLGLFTFLFLKRYEIESVVLWPRVILVLFLIATISIPIAIISSRFVTLLYFVLVMVRINSKPKYQIDDHLSVNDILFYTLFIGLLMFRSYRVLTMFGYI